MNVYDSIQPVGLSKSLSGPVRCNRGTMLLEGAACGPRPEFARYALDVGGATLIDVKGLPSGWAVLAYHFCEGCELLSIGRDFLARLQIVRARKYDFSRMVYEYHRIDT